MGLALGAGCATSVAVPPATLEAPRAAAADTAAQAATPVPLEVQAESETARAILTAAEAYKGEEYVFGGRLGRKGCLRHGKPVRCREGIDCQSLLFFANEDVLGTRWWKFSVMPTETVADRELGEPVEGVSGVLREALDPSLLAPGDVLFFLFDGYNLDVDGPLHVQDGRQYGTWHTGFFYGVQDGKYQVLHAAPGDVEKVQPLNDIPFDAIYAVRR